MEKCDLRKNRESFKIQIYWIGRKLLAREACAVECCAS